MELAVIEAEAKKLSAPEKLLLIERLQDGMFDTELQQKQIAEVQSRMLAYRAGELEAHDAFEVIAKLKADLKK